MTQAPRLEREVNAVDADEDVDGYQNPAFVQQDTEVLSRRKTFAAPAMPRTASTSVQGRNQFAVPRPNLAGASATKHGDWWHTDAHGDTGGMMVRARSPDGAPALDVDGFEEMRPSRLPNKRARDDDGGDVDQLGHAGSALEKKAKSGGGASLTANLPSESEAVMWRASEGDGG